MASIPASNGKGSDSVACQCLMINALVADTANLDDIKAKLANAKTLVINVDPSLATLTEVQKIYKRII